jgi:hypothetical protein
MQISNPHPNASLKGNVPAKPLDVLNRLQQLGSITANVVSVMNKEALLSTCLGKIRTSNALDLKAGDTIQVRLDANNQNPILKVTLLHEQLTLLAANKFLKLLPLLSTNQPVIATVVSQQSNKTLLQFRSVQTLIPLPIKLKPGQLLTLVHHEAFETIEIKLVDNQRVLKSALSQLLSDRSQPSLNKSLQPLLQLAKSVLKIDSEHMLAAKLINKNQRFMKAATSNSGRTLPSSHVSAVASELKQLIHSLPTISSLSHRDIQRSVEIATLMTLEPQPNKGLSNSSLLSILRRLPQTEQGLNQLIQSLLKTNHRQAALIVQQLKESQSNDEAPLLTQFKDAIKSTEQSLNQGLFQKTSLRFQQELQQPIAFNLNIPYLEQQEVKSLQLKIRQKSKENVENQAWEIRLSFEFNLLGLISTHVSLDGDTLSTNFWAVKEGTKNKITDALPEFKQQLVKSGFNLGYFFCYLGQPLPGDDNNFSPMPDSLLNIKV